MSDLSVDTEMEIVPASEEVPIEAKKRIHEDEDETRSPDDAKRIKIEGSKRPDSPCSTTPVPTPKSTTPAPSPSGSATKNSTVPTNSAPPTTTLYTPPATATVFPKSSWLDKMPALHLNDAQKAALDKAKAFAKEMQSVLLNSAGSNHSPPPLPTLLLSSNPGLASGIDPRSLSVLSRIYVGSINFELTEQHLRVVFGQYGAIKSVSMSLDPLTGKHKGFCFIEFETPEGASLALDSMNGAELGGRQLKVGRPNNYTAATAADNIGLSPPPKTRIYVSNVNEYVSEEDLLSIFESFGKINHCALMPDLITRKHKGYG
ncbi:2210_t:CDS:2, partial [Funneliformis caledonium]